MPQNVKITIIQTDIKWASPKDNIISAEAMLDGAQQSDLYVLPEMWATGFGAPPTEACTTLPLEWMRRTAARRQCAICGGLAAKAGDGTQRNRLYFVRPDGTSCFYDKRHLFAYTRQQAHRSRIHGHKIPSAHMLRPALPRMGALPRRLRCHHPSSQLAREQAARMADIDMRTGDRKPMLRDSRQPHRQRPYVPIRRRKCRHRP